MPPELIRSRARRFGVAILCAKVALVPLVFDASADASFTLPKALVSHSLSYALVAVLIGLFLRFGTRLVMRSYVHVAVIAYLLVNVLATALAADPRLALYGAHMRMLGLGTIADWTVLYFAFVILVRTRRDLLAVLGALIAPTALVLLYEVVQIAGRDPFRWTIDSGGRPFSTLGQPTTLGAYLTTVAACVTVIAVFVEGLRRSHRALLLWWAALLLVGAIDTGTRSVLLGAIGAFVTVLGVQWSRGVNARARAIGFAAAAIAVVVLAAVVALTPLGSRLATTVVGPDAGGAVDPSTAGRLDLYRIALAMVQDRPLLGYGPDSFAVGVPRFRPEGAAPNIRQSLATSAHGWLPYVTTGSGLLGLTSFAAIMILAFRRLVASRSTLPLVGAAMVAAFLGAGLTTIDDIALDPLLWLGLALIASDLDLSPASPATESTARRTRARARGRSRPSTAERGGRVDLPIVVSVIGILAMLVSVNAWGAARASKASEDLRLTRQASPAIATALASVDADPGRAEYWHTLGFAYIGAQRYRDASVAFDRAIALAPYDIVHIDDQIQTQLLLANAGDTSARDRARSYSDQAVRTDPNNPRSHYVRARLMQALGDLDEAERSVQRALALDPGSTSEALYVTAVQVFAARGRADDAIAVGEQGLKVLPSTVVALRVELARVLFARGRLNEALVQVETALSIQPNLTAAQQLRTQIRTAMGL